MDDRDILMDALKFHGHRCYASVAGVRCGLAALRTLGVKRSGGTQLYAILETGEEHGGMCFGDGVQYTTGCTFGKGNIRKLGYGKFVLTLVDNRTGRSVRVATRNEVIKRNQESEFIQYRKRGVPASRIDAELIEPNVDFILASADADLFQIGPVTETKLSAGRPHDFSTIICAECGEVAVERYARVKDGRIVCMPCAEKS